MKKLIFAILMFSLAYSTSFASECIDEECTVIESARSEDDGPQRIQIPGTECSISIWYNAKKINCNGEIHYEFEIITWIFVSDNTCPELSSPVEMIETAMGIILADPSLNPFGSDFYPVQGECRTDYHVRGHSCWYIVMNDLDPNGMTRRQYAPCTSDQQCCKPYKVCKDYQGNISVAPQAYDPLPCEYPCYPICP